MGERAEDFSYNSFEFPPSPREYDSLDESLRSEQPDHESGNSFQESFVSSLRKNVNMPKFIGRLFMESM